MSENIGRLRQVGIGKETVKGTAVVPTFWLPVSAFKSSPTVEIKQKDGAIGRIDGAYSSEITMKSSEPEIEGYLTDKAAGLLFLASLGTVTTGSVSAGVYPHAFTVLNTNAHPSLTVSFKDLNMAKQIPYCVMDELELEANVDDYLIFKASMIGKFEADGTLTPSFYATDNIFIGRHVSVKMADDIAGLAAATALNLQSFNLKIAKNANPVWGLGSAEPTSITNGQLEVKGSVSAIQVDETWRDLFIDNDKKVMQITIENTDVTIGSGSGHPKIVITLNSVDFNPYKEDGKLSDLISENIDFNCLYDLTNSKSIEITLYNTQATY